MDREIKQIIFQDFHHIIYLLKKCRSKSMKLRLSRECIMLTQLCKELEIDDYPKLESYTSKSIWDIDKREYEGFVEQFNQDLDYHVQFSKNIEQLDSIKYENQLLYTIEDSLFFADNIKIAFDFLKEFNPDLLVFLKKKIGEGRVIFQDRESNKENDISMVASSYLSCGNFSSYIVQNVATDIQDASVLCHEIGHCYIGEKNNVTSYNIVRQKDINCFSEVYTYFINFCFYEYCIKHHLYVSDNEKIRNGYNGTLISYLENMKKCVQNPNELYYDEVLDILNYSYGITIAYHFFDRYLKDPEKTKIEMNQFIEDDGSYSFMEMLKKYNLKDEIIDSKVLKKYI